MCGFKESRHTCVISVVVTTYVTKQLKCNKLTEILINVIIIGC